LNHQYGPKQVSFSFALLRIRWQVTPKSYGETMKSFAKQIIETEGFVNGLWRPGCLANGVGICVSSTIRMGKQTLFF
jgi:hypothetical protein